MRSDYERIARNFNVVRFRMAATCRNEYWSYGICIGTRIKGVALESYVVGAANDSNMRCPAARCGEGVFEAAVLYGHIGRAIFDVYWLIAVVSERVVAEQRLLNISQADPEPAVRTCGVSVMREARIFHCYILHRSIRRIELQVIITVISKRTVVH